ncbi:class I SAM-dependent methyltransferase [Tengunoibacter tsumagoiensis]|uniref:SAM-dependent methyltransferase n=1 Tax=Tengunoibacter tsumagoiensis TaxID=2014871 RepID=A0A402A5F3_9CHLR|nr:SAM-dependent methyltransferase [Tengunoibacter tsumagoiensis]GCE14330.1 SAM-dependent methyltransferase [Tengunoibacter tsumagoiensis]
MPAALLHDLILDAIQQRGPLSFADYMRMALYEPGYGYYVTGPARMGWEGDYYTSSDVAAFFANCLGRQLRQMWDQLGRPTPFVVLEQGAGRGNLALGVRLWASQEDPLLAAALDYQTEDIKQGLDALTSQITPSVILSNELVDAFPVHVVEKRGDQLLEVFVTAENGRLSETLASPSSPQIATYLDDYKIPWRSFDDGWRGEINLDAEKWMAHAAQLIFGPSPKRKRRGFILTIDYGDLAKQLYSPYRYHGTLACYFQHQLTDRPLVRPGEQDITAHVNFTALLQAGRKAGLRLDTFLTQREWLTKMGIYDELEQIKQRDFAIIDTDRASDQGQIALFQWYNLRQRVAALTEPSGMGNFKVLILKR